MIKEIKVGSQTVKLKGKPFVIGVDTFGRDDWFAGYFTSKKKAIEYAKENGASMIKMHAYDAKGNHIGEGGTF